MSMSGMSGMSGETFAVLLTPCLPSVRKLVQSRLRALYQAEDALQQTLFQTFRHRDRLQSYSKFKSWLYWIATNEIYMFHRCVRVPVPLPESPTVENRDRARLGNNRSSSVRISGRRSDRCASRSGGHP